MSIQNKKPYNILQPGLISLINVKKYKLEDIQPPVGIKSMDWIKSGLKPGKW